MYTSLIFCYFLQAIEKSPNREACPEYCSSASDKNILEDDFSDMEALGFEVIHKDGLFMALALVTKSFFLHFGINLPDPLLLM